MTGVETATGSMDRNEVQTDIVDPAPVVPSPFRTLIETKLRVWRSLRQPTVQQIEWCLFWEEYLKQKRDEK
jgi:hypothetical protein